MEAVIKFTGATALDIAWCAGLFEGEGCISHSTAAPSCALSMTDEDVIRKFHQIVGIGSVRKLPSKQGRKDMWAWQTAGYRSVQFVIALFWNWLGSRRRSKAVEELKKFSATPARSKSQCKNGHSLLDKENVYLRPDRPGHRICKECSRQFSRKHYLSKLN